MTTILERFWGKVEKRGHGGCWRFTGHTLRGYGQFSLDKRSPIAAHRFAYELIVGPIPDGMTLDHTCHDPKRCAGGPTCPHRSCVNPLHLKPATRGDNVLRGNSIAAMNRAKTECGRGHPFDEANTRIDPRTGQRCCRACARDAVRRMRARQSSCLTDDGHRRES